MMETPRSWMGVGRLWVMGWRALRRESMLESGGRFDGRG